ERRRLGVPFAAETEKRGRRVEPFGQVREGRDADSAADEERPLHVEAVTVAERAEDGDLVAGRRGAERSCPWPNRVDQKRELAVRRRAQAHRPRQRTAGRLEHEELTRNAGLQAAPFYPEQRVRADRLGARDLHALTPWHQELLQSW